MPPMQLLTASKRLAGFQIVTLRTNERIRMASLAGLQVSAALPPDDPE